MHNRNAPAAGALVDRLFATYIPTYLGVILLLRNALPFGFLVGSSPHVSALGILD